MDSISKRSRKSKQAEACSTAGYGAVQRPTSGKVRCQYDLQSNKDDSAALTAAQCGSMTNTSMPTVAAKDESSQHNTPLDDAANSYVCKVCGKRFKQSCHLSRHMPLHTLQKHACHVCGREFTRKDCLTKHIFRIHLGERPFACDVCGMTFPESAALKRHEVVHAERKPFQCDECGRSFSQSTYLKHHMLTHGGSRTMPYACDECGLRFSLPSRLRKHALIHMGVKPYQCDICGRHYSRSEYIKQHKKTVHASLFQS